VTLLCACGSGSGGASQGTDTGIPAGGCRPDTRPHDAPVLIADALVDLDAFWCAEFTRRGRRYRPITGFHPFHGNHRPNVACPLSRVGRNAFYCSGDMTVSYDVDWFTKGVSPIDPGNLDEAVVVLAHEFGHHLQHLLGTGGKLSSQLELQADCYAGVYLNAVDRGLRPVRLRNPALESVLTMFVVADAPTHFTDSNWFDQDTHGDALTRRYAWGRGYTSGDTAQCAGFAQYEYRPPMAFGANRLAVPPGALTTCDRNGQTVSFTTEHTDIMVDDASPLDGPAIASFQVQSTAHDAKRWSGWTITWGDPAKGFAEGRTSFAVRDYTATTTHSDGTPLVRHGTMLLGVGSDGVAFILDGSRPGGPSDASLDEIDAALIAAANGSSALLG
jgi:predicted metalloprotease